MRIRSPSVVQVPGLGHGVRFTQIMRRCYVMCGLVKRGDLKATGGNGTPIRERGDQANSDTTLRNKLISYGQSAESMGCC
jgi:hypothetical protein